MNPLWKTMPDHPGYQINRTGWVRNERKYVVASGKGVSLKNSGGVRAFLSQKRLLDIAANLFGEEDVTEKAGAPVESAPVEIAPEKPASEAAPVKNRNRRQLEDGEHAEYRVKPDTVIALRDPWREGTIEQASSWDWAVVM